MGPVHVGTCSWTEKTMVDLWYPKGVATPEQRLRYYASKFDTVEVDSPFYALPVREYAEKWVARTPRDFTFHVKAFGPMTGHDVDERARALPKFTPARASLRVRRAGFVAFVAVDD